MNADDNENNNSDANENNNLDNNEKSSEDLLIIKLSQTLIDLSKQLDLLKEKRDKIKSDRNRIDIIDNARGEKMPLDYQLSTELKEALLDSPYFSEEFKQIINEIEAAQEIIKESK